jgi:hypothetical protein
MDRDISNFSETLRDFLKLLILGKIKGKIVNYLLSKDF